MPKRKSRWIVNEAGTHTHTHIHTYTQRWCMERFCMVIIIIIPCWCFYDSYPFFVTMSLSFSPFMPHPPTQQSTHSFLGFLYLLKWSNHISCDYKWCLLNTSHTQVNTYFIYSCMYMPLNHHRSFACVSFCIRMAFGDGEWYN